MSSSSSALKRTPLYEVHVAAGARMVEFGGWEMPVQYSSILKEHAAVRSAAGLFDISHMGEIRVKGTDACRFLNQMLTNDAKKIAVGSSQYSLLLNERGGIVDDLFVYRVGETEYLLVVNAGHIEEDFAALNYLKEGNVELTNESDHTAAVALQGPASAAILNRWIPGAADQLGHHAIAGFSSNAGRVWIGRTGYTGEDGFEIICAEDAATGVWRQLLEAGADQGLIPCGLGARDTLRMEVCYPLNGHELGPDITPLEAGLGFFVDFTKPDFRGKHSLEDQKSHGVPRKSVALVVKEAGAPPRAGYAVCVQGKKIGLVTSGCLGPTLQKGMALALIEVGHSKIGNTVDIEIRGKYFAAEIVKKPIYRKTP